MPEILKANFTPSQSRISSIEINIFKDNELSYHGAPSTLTIRMGRMDKPIFAECMHKLCSALNTTADNSPLRATEMTSNTTYLRGTDVFPSQGRHNLSGGDDTGVIDVIGRQDTTNVLAKALRELKSLNVLSASEYESALRQFLEQGVSYKDMMAYKNAPGYSGEDHKPTYTFRGEGLSAMAKEALAPAQEISSPGDKSPSIAYNR